MAVGTPLSATNAFGVGSPSWNLSFPTGHVTNLTAAEILAYFPHWLKSIDVINRFVANGAKSSTLASMINEFRHQPKGQLFKSNSVQIMMSYAMRHAGYKGWKVGTHRSFESEMDEGSLSVKDFRSPRLTHPRTVTHRTRDESRFNSEADPVAFKDLAIHVRKHPSGPDALDLTRCVEYALEYQDEEWLFPTDFERLVIHLGGPQTVTPSHYDRQVFARRDKSLSPSKTASPTSPLALHLPQATTMRRTRVQKALHASRSATPDTAALKQKNNEELGRLTVGNKRRSGRLRGKVFDLREDDSDTTLDKDLIDSPYSGFSTPAKKRKTSWIASKLATPNDSDFVQDDESELDDEVPEAEEVSDEDDLESPSRQKHGRVAAQKARANIQSFLLSGNAAAAKTANIASAANNKSGMPLLKSQTHFNVSSEDAARAALIYSMRQPKFVKPPVLSPHRLRVDSSSIYLYAEVGCRTIEEMWASALSSTRFGGPRRSPPFRELYRLTDPSPSDDSDWAENIRWAKEQHRAFDSVTWTEYDYHLEQITEARRQTLWVSEEAIQVGM